MKEIYVVVREVSEIIRGLDKQNREFQYATVLGAFTSESVAEAYVQKLSKADKTRFYYVKKLELDNPEFLIAYANYYGGELE